MKKTGRPKIEWQDEQWEQFKNLCKIQCTASEICSVMDLSEETLNRLCEEKFKMRFSEYIKSEAAGGKASLRRLQWKAAENGNSTILIWLGKQYLNQTDKIDNNINFDNIDIDFGDIEGD